MTKEDYIAISNAIITVALGSEAERQVAERVAKNIARVLQADNARFNMVKFLTACGFPIRWES